MNLIGIILIVVGLFFLFSNVGVLPDLGGWSIVWPILLVLAGLWFVSAERGERWFGLYGRGRSKRVGRPRESYGHDRDSRGNR